MAMQLSSRFRLLRPLPGAPPFSRPLQCPPNPTPAEPPLSPAPPLARPPCSSSSSSLPVRPLPPLCLRVPGAFPFLGERPRTPIPSRTLAAAAARGARLRRRVLLLRASPRGRPGEPDPSCPRQGFLHLHQVIRFSPSPCSVLLLRFGTEYS
jgi:hypothetical protein